MDNRRWFWRADAFAALCLLLVACANVPGTPNVPAPSFSSTPTGTPGSPVGLAGMGDPYYPQLGNDGYDVTHYTIALDVDPNANIITGTTTIDAMATQRLDTFNLDFEGLTVVAVQVNAGPVTFSRQEHELTIVPRQSLAQGASFSTQIDYRGSPEPVKDIASPNLFGTVGWFHSASGAINVLSEPNGAAGWFPVNDHPRDKATFRFEITVPMPWVVAASGTLRETTDQGKRTRYIWEMNRPMASYLASVNIDRYVAERVHGPGGVEIRNYYPADLSDQLKVNTGKLPAMIEYFNRVFGPYPFDEYGIVVTARDIDPCRKVIGGAYEAQTLSVHCPKAETLDEYILAHELAHQWFGNDVSLKNWQDIWLKEGMATYAEWLWRTRDQDVNQLDEYVAEQKRSYSPLTKPGRPPADDLYQWEDYMGGALALHALRLKVGDETFFNIIHAYLDRYRYANAGTDDFIATANEISGQELSAFLNSWLMETNLPELPKRAK